MLRRYYISDDLHDIESLQAQLQQRGIVKPQFHVLSEKDAEVENHHLNAIEAVLKKDVIHSTEIGALIGGIAATAFLLLTYIMGWHQSAAGWLPFVFLAVVILGFCTWEGGLIGIQIPNHKFKRFQKLLKEGKHVLFMDIDREQVDALDSVIADHKTLLFAGEGEATPSWVVKGQDNFNKFMKVMP